MVDREDRKQQAAKHLALMKGAFASETAATVSAAVIYEDGEGRDLPIPDALFESTETMVTTAFAPAALKDATGKTLVVDPASFTRPGGAYEDGAFGPEQVLCADSNLYPILCELKKAYHEANRGYARGQLFTDRALYLPDVVFLHDGTIRKADVLAIPEPNRTRALENHRSERECDQCLADRIHALLHIAAAHECETLICGAFGCGRSGYETSQVISLFQEWIAAHPGTFARIIFAVGRAQAGAFEAAFERPKHEAAKQTDAADKEDAEAEAEADDFDFRNVDLPEGITLR